MAGRARRRPLGSRRGEDGGIGVRAGVRDQGLRFQVIRAREQFPLTSYPDAPLIPDS